MKPIKDFVDSKDGTRIAYTRYGSGPAVVLVDGALATQEFGPNKALAEALSSRYTVFTYDRRGRGGSGDNPPFEVEREFEDLASVAVALVKPAGATDGVDARGLPRVPGSEDVLHGVRHGDEGRPRRHPPGGEPGLRDAAPPCRPAVLPAAPPGSDQAVLVATAAAHPHHRPPWSEALGAGTRSPERAGSAEAGRAAPAGQRARRAGLAEASLPPCAPGQDDPPPGGQLGCPEQPLGGRQVDQEGRQH